MNKQINQKLIDVISDAAQPITRDQTQYASLLEKIGDARFVLIGEATHGTKEFYQTRIEISQALIEKKGFMAIAIEGDWPDVYRVHRYLQGAGEKTDWQSALTEFTRFPTWMWRNETIPPFLNWLRNFNDQLTPTKKIGFYGLDLYSLYTSIQAVLSYLSKIDEKAFERARARYACFDHVKSNNQSSLPKQVKKSCAKATIDQLLDLQHHAFEYVRKDGSAAYDEYFYAIQNARLIKNAEHYYRAVFEEHVSSWNVRDTHMMETLTVLADHLEKRFHRPAKIIVWAHNSHIGDARATEMGEKGEINIGQLVKEQYDTDAYLIGFSTYDGQVTAASNWDEPAETKSINPGLPGTYEALFHQVRYPNFLLDLKNPKLEHFLKISRLQRAIGVIYRPDTERESHYFFTRLPYQFDSIIHIDHTNAVKPLDVNIEIV